MLTGFYSGAAAVDAYERRHEVFAANLANITTPGYRRRVESFTELKGKESTLQGSRVQAPAFTPRIDFTPGELKHTESPFDLALSQIYGDEGNAFFAVESHRGTELYTRNGGFAVNDQGEIVHASSGFPVLSTSGIPFRLNPAEGAPVIDRLGNVSQNGAALGQLRIVRFNRLDLLNPVESGLYDTVAVNPGESAEGRVNVMQGYLENSNTNPVTELVKMVANYRGYEASQKVIKQMDRSLQSLIRQTAI